MAPHKEGTHMKKYKVTKLDSRSGEKTECGGGYTEEDVKAITKGYKFNGLFYDRKGSHIIYTVEEEK